jgi:hypothetical protein
MKRSAIILLLAVGCGSPSVTDREYINLNRAYRATATEIIKRNPAILSEQEAQLLDDMAASADVRERRWLGENGEVGP